MYRLLLLSLLQTATAITTADCHHPPYDVHIVSVAPLVLYLVGFVTPEERHHLLSVTSGSFARSAVTDTGTDTDTGTRGRGVHHAVRTSQSTTAPAGDPVAHCLAARALRLQGLLGGGGGGGGGGDALARVEPLQLVRYGAGAHYHYHTDWFPEAPSSSSSSSSVHAAPAVGGNRISSIFAYLEATEATATATASTGNASASAPLLRGGGTHFPMLDPLEESAEEEEEALWPCAYIDCDAPRADGVTFRPVAGNAVFWANLLPDGGGQGGRVGDPRTLHAGLPVLHGRKVGLNIWTREGVVPGHVRGQP